MSTSRSTNFQKCEPQRKKEKSERKEREKNLGRSSLFTGTRRAGGREELTPC